MKLAWGARVSPEFRRRVVALSELLMIDPSWLMACIAFETGRTFDPAIRNAAGSGATGLIQFMPSTARRLGTTTDALAAMTAEEQLAWVELYFREHAGRLRSLADTYMAILWPRAVGQPDDYAIATTADGNTYLQNRGLDVDGDGRITKAEAAAKVARLLDEGLEPGNVYEDGTQPAAPIEDRSTPAAPPATTTEDTMGTIALPLLAQLLPQVLSLFSQRAQAAIGRVTGADPVTAAQFTTDLFKRAGELVGVPVTDDATAVQAVAKLQERKAAGDVQPVQQLEAHALDYLDKLAPLFDRLAETDRWARESQLAGQRAAMERQAAADPATVRVVVKNVNDTSSGVLIGLTAGIVVAMICKAAWPAIPDYVTPLLTLAGPLFGQVMKERGAIIAYYFDGTPTSNAAAAINAQIAKVGNPPAENGTR